MGLFRRGTKLLKLGSGLRDCCCRPEDPEECWCTDWCRYYFRFGTDFFPETDLQYESPCASLSANRFYGSRGGPIGLLTELSPLIPGFEVEPFAEYDTFYNGPRILYKSLHRGPVSAETVDALRERFVFWGSTSTLTYSTIATIQVRCAYTSALEGPQRTGLFASVTIIQDLYGNGNGIYFGSYSVTVPLAESASACIADSRWVCSAFYEDKEHRHLLNDLEIEATQDGVTVGSVFREWDNKLTYTIDNLSLNWEATNFPFTSFSATLKSKSFCRSGNCDCGESLTGMTVTFEGKTFTYGSLQQFVDGVDTWEETLPGLFRRTTRETCDGTYVAAVKIAEVFCETVDGTDYWTVYLDSECYERDEATCPASADARRIMQWTGVFTCGEDGKPGGTPHSATDAAEPPDLDSNTTLGTPAAECAGDLDLPAISFG